MIQIDLITGFLGSGKTTFIRKYAKYLIDQGLNIGILENDFGAVNVDAMLLQDILGDNCIGIESGIPKIDVIGVMTDFAHKGKQYKTDDIRYRLYVRLWCRPYKLRIFLKKIRMRLQSVLRKKREKKERYKMRKLLVRKNKDKKYVAAITTIELVLILVILIALLLIFKEQLISLITTIFEKVTSESSGI